ncbi:MAG: methyltransferase [Pseudomonadota bacterium]
MGLYDQWLSLRNHWLTSPKFHDFAIRFPLTRPIFRKRQSEVFDVVSGFVYSQILHICVVLGVLEEKRLIAQGLTLEEFSELTDLGPDEAQRLAKGAASLRILEERNGKFLFGDLGAALSINAGALAMIRHHSALYKDLSEPVELLANGRRETHLSQYWDYARNIDPKKASAEEVREYSNLMSASQQAVSDEVIACYDFSNFESLMDVGGGQGTFLANVSKAAPHLNLRLFDLPEVVAMAENHGISSELPTGTKFYGGSFFEDDLPKGADLISLIRILHDHDDEPAQVILEKIYAALPVGGKLLLAEPMSTGGHAARIADAYFNFYLYAMGSGRPRTPVEISKMMKLAGFSRVKVVQTRAPFTTSLLVGEK